LKSEGIGKQIDCSVEPVFGTMDQERAYGVPGMREQDRRAMEGMLLDQTVAVDATNSEEDGTRGASWFLCDLD
jgi:hypothetical protein